MDKEQRRVYVPFAGGLADFSKAEFEDASWGQVGQYDFADFEAARGLLLSSNPTSTTRNIVHVDPVTDVQTPVTNGSYAVWGPDDWIYFCVGDTELWRCKLDGSQRKVVFTGIEGEAVPVEGYAVAPCFDQSRSRLAYTCYSAGGGIPGNPVSGIVLIDFAAREYRVLPNEYRYNFAWIVEPSEATPQPSHP